MFNTQKSDHRRNNYSLNMEDIIHIIFIHTKFTQKKM